jgi:ribosomal protein L30E
LAPRTPAEQRCCTACGEPAGDGLLVHWFLQLDHRPRADWSGRAERISGRGASVHAAPACVAALARPGVLARVFKEKVIVPTEAEALASFVALGEEHFFQRLGLGLRAGAVHVGSEAVGEVLGRKKLALLLTASDLGAAVLKKEASVARAYAVDHVSYAGGGARIGQALGREFVGSLAVRRGPFGNDLVFWSKLLAAFPGSGFSQVSLES